MTARFGRVLCLVAAVLAGAGCQTGSEPDEELPPRIGEPIPFQPAHAAAGLRLERGSYPQLFSPSSYALWVGPALLRERRAVAEAEGQVIDPEADTLAPVIDANFIVFECHLESLFSDMSIGYDVVGLRGMDVYLETPAGSRVPPAQVIVGSELEEAQQGALRVFRRTNLIVFPRAGLELAIPAAAAAAPATRLILEGYNSRFFFAWEPQLPGETRPPKFHERAWVDKTRMGYNEFFARMKNFLHTFD